MNEKFSKTSSKHFRKKIAKFSAKQNERIFRSLYYIVCIMSPWLQITSWFLFFCFSVQTLRSLEQDCSKKHPDLPKSSRNWVFAVFKIARKRKNQTNKIFCSYDCFVSIFCSKYFVHEIFCSVDCFETFVSCLVNRTDFCSFQNCQKTNQWVWNWEGKPKVTAKLFPLTKVRFFCKLCFTFGCSFHNFETNEHVTCHFCILLSVCVYVNVT